MVSSEDSGSPGGQGAFPGTGATVGVGAMPGTGATVGVGGMPGTGATVGTGGIVGGTGAMVGTGGVIGNTGGTATGGTGTGGMVVTMPGDEWILYDGESGALTVDRTGTGITAQIHATATAAHTESASVSLSIPIGELINDISKSKGVKFNIRGTGSVLFQAQSALVIPISAGGSCNPDATSCWNAHEKTVSLTGANVTHTILWDDLAQSWGTDTNTVVLYGSEILLLSWIIMKEQAGEFWLEGIELIPDDSAPATGIASLISKAQFNAINSNGMSPFTYEGFLAAAKRFPAFGGDGNPDWAKREIAMFLANSKRETGNFTYVDEINKTGDYCDESKPYGCPAGADQYYGRGAMQLSWNYNYKSAGDYLGIDLLGNPNQVISSEELLWDTGIWFWMNNAYPSSPHNAYKQGLGATIRIINSIECNGGNAAAVNERILNYNNALSALGVDAAGTSNGC